MSWWRILDTLEKLRVNLSVRKFIHRCMKESKSNKTSIQARPFITTHQNNQIQVFYSSVTGNIGTCRVIGRRRFSSFNLTEVDLSPYFRQYFVSSIQPTHNRQTPDGLPPLLEYVCVYLCIRLFKLRRNLLLLSQYLALPFISLFQVQLGNFPGIQFYAGCIRNI